MFKKDNIIVKTLTPEEINKDTIKQQQQRSFLQKRIEAPLLRINIGEKKNLIVVDEGCDTMAIGFHYLALTEKLGIKVMCGGYDGKCLLCALQKYYPEKIKPTYFYGCFTVIDVLEKKLKILLLHFKHLQNIYALVLNTPEFLQGVALSITRVDRYTYTTNIEISDKNVIPRYKSKNVNVKPFDYFQYFGPFTAEELEQLGYDLSLIQDKISTNLLSSQQQTTKSVTDGFLEIDMIIDNLDSNQEQQNTGVDSVIDNVIKKDSDLNEDEDDLDIMKYLDENDFPENFDFKDDEKNF